MNNTRKILKIPIFILLVFILIYNVNSINVNSKSNLETFSYKIKKGDSFYDLSQRFHTSVDTLTSLNPKSKPKNLTIGNVMKISPGEDILIHKVQFGDTLWEISQKYSSKINIIANKNNIQNPNLIYEDDILAIPKNDINESQSVIWINTNDWIVSETKIYVRTTTHLFDKMLDGNFVELVEKGTKLKVLNRITDEVGAVTWYRVKYNDLEGYIRAKYTVLNKEDANEIYDPSGFFKSKSLTFLDYFPREKKNYISNPRQDEAYSFYLSSIKDIDKYIELAKETKVNTFVIDIKTYYVLYESDVVKENSKSTYRLANYSKQEYLNAIKKLKDEGFYVIGRVVVFKDALYARDNVNSAIFDKSVDKVFTRGHEVFVSAYDRNVWKYNVDIAKEAAREFNFNEIQFDYIRFIDSTQKLDEKNLLDYHNKYNEHKAEAIQRFAMYACDELSDLEVYVSADVFGEVGYVTVPSGLSYGQQWHAISNVVDYISPMVYPDHYDKSFTNGEPPYLYPYELVYKVSKISNRMNEDIETPATIRTWIQAYDTYKNRKVPYDSEEIEKQIQGLYDAGLKGFMPWNPTDDVVKYNDRIDAFKKTYK